MKKLLMKIIRLYQKYISPATQPTCRYHPTCSSYALKAINKHGAFKGSLMGSARILRCNPFVEGGVDTVPDYFTMRRNPENIGEQYVPDYLLSVNLETKKEINKLLGKYKEKLIISEELPNSLTILQNLVDLEKLKIEDLRKEFSEDEFEYLKDIQILPSSGDSHFKYFTLSEDLKNKEYVSNIQAYDEGILLGEDYPLVVLEDYGVWYTNLPILMDRFLINRGVTEKDFKNESYHLWMVLKAIERENEK